MVWNFPGFGKNQLPFEKGFEKGFSKGLLKGKKGLDVDDQPLATMETEEGKGKGKPFLAWALKPGESSGSDHPEGSESEAPDWDEEEHKMEVQHGKFCEVERDARLRNGPMTPKEEDDMKKKKMMVRPSTTRSCSTLDCLVAARVPRSCCMTCLWCSMAGGLASSAQPTHRSSPSASTSSWLASTGRRTSQSKGGQCVTAFQTQASCQLGAFTTRGLWSASLTGASLCALPAACVPGVTSYLAFQKGMQ